MHIDMYIGIIIIIIIIMWRYTLELGVSVGTYYNAPVYYAHVYYITLQYIIVVIQIFFLF